MKQPNIIQDFFTSSVDLNQLQNILQYQFNDISLLRRALVQPNLANLDGCQIEHFDTYDRDEFLGDSILYFVITDVLYNACPYDTPHQLSTKRNILVSNKILAEISVDLGLIKFLFSASNFLQNNDRSSEKTHADIIESLVGAVHLDGGLDKSTKLIKRLLSSEIAELKYGDTCVKTILNDWVQAQKKVNHLYTVIDAPNGKNPCFLVELSVTGFETQTGAGVMKQSAERVAAQKMLEFIQR